MIEAGIKKVDFIVVNTDLQALNDSHAPVKINSAAS
jgi:cell division GTPase FtsZ